MRQAAKSLSILALTLAFCQPLLAGTLDDVKARDQLRCGVNGEAPGLSFKDASGQWSGMDVDFCRAVAAAVLGSKDKVVFIPLTVAAAPAAMAKGEVDLLARNFSWNLERDVTAGISFVGILLFDGQGFMVRRDTGVLSALELDGMKVCALEGSTSADHVRRYFDRHRMKLDLRLFPGIEAASKAYQAGDCQVLTSDHLQLHGLRAAMATGEEHRVLPEIISKEPLSPAVREGDARWFDIVRWTLFILIDAEELGIDSHNVKRAMGEAQASDTRLLLDVEGQVAKALGLDRDWVARVIGQVGNYGEIYARNLGDQSPHKVKRSFNALWNDGGLLYAPPPR
jgi:general L-amino acid transport system substrate-binding protein